MGINEKTGNQVRHRNVGKALAEIIRPVYEPLISARKEKIQIILETSKTLRDLSYSSIEELQQKWQAQNCDQWTEREYEDAFKVMKKFLGQVSGGNKEKYRKLEEIKDEGKHEMLGIRLINTIGRGSYGKVWKVEYPAIGNECYALKAITVDSHSHKTKRGVNQEVQSLKRLSHHGIVAYHKHFTYIREGFEELHIVMELCDSSVEDLLKRSDGPMDTTATLVFIEQMQDALKYLYDERIIHRDIKPGNILVSTGNILVSNITYKLCDFGVVKDLSTTTRSMNETATMSMAGSFKYMSPQMRHNHFSKAKYSKYSAKVDAWSIGAVILEWCIGWKGEESLDEDIDNLDNHMNKPIVDSIVSHLLVKNQKGRKYLHDPVIMEALKELKLADKQEKKHEAKARPTLWRRFFIWFWRIVRLFYA